MNCSGEIQMEVDSIVKGLHPLEIKVLSHFQFKEEISTQNLMKNLSFNDGQCNQVFSWLSTPLTKRLSTPP